MRSLILGGTGLAGQAFVRECGQRNIQTVSVARSNAQLQCDISRPENLRELLNDFSPDMVINCAAAINLQECENDPSMARAINALPLGILANWSIKHHLPFIHISTDHFFCGDTNKKHPENAKVSIINEYAYSKYLGEQLALTSPHALVLRTNIIGMRGWSDPSFAEWAIASVTNNSHVTLFNDIWTSSIDVGTFSRLALVLLLDYNKAGLFNLASSQVYSKEQFVLEVADQLNMTFDNYKIGSGAFLKPKRANSLGLDVSKVTQIVGDVLPNLHTVVLNLLDEKRKRN